MPLVNHSHGNALEGSALFEVECEPACFVEFVTVEIICLDIARVYEVVNCSVDCCLAPEREYLLPVGGALVYPLLALMDMSRSSYQEFQLQKQYTFDETKFLRERGIKARSVRLVKGKDSKLLEFGRFVTIGSGHA